MTPSQKIVKIYTLVDFPYLGYIMQMITISDGSGIRVLETRNLEVPYGEMGLKQVEQVFFLHFWHI